MCETIQFGDGGAAIICGRRHAKATPCKFCGRPSTKLCDFPMYIGNAVQVRTCDAPMCDACATNVGPDKDHCPDHVAPRPSDQLGFAGMQGDSGDAEDAHARRVLYSGAGPWPLADLQREVLRAMLFHPGAARAIPLRDPLAKVARSLKDAPAERDVKDAVRSLVVDFKVRIGSSRSQPWGYYLITSVEEARDAAHPFIEEIKKLAQRVRVLLDPHDLAEFENQLSLAEKKEAV
jgi:hypothetical protein